MEGPSLVIIKEELAPFVGQRIRQVSGNAKCDKELLQGGTINEIASWGKHLLIVVGSITLRIHFLMFGSYRINERKEGVIPRIRLETTNGELNFYSCAASLIEGDLRSQYDWKTDPLSPEWNAARALSTIRKKPSEYVCDILLDQNIFSGVGNIIKNEVLFRLKLHPLRTIDSMDLRSLRELVEDTTLYCAQFYEWKKRYELKTNWQIYRRKKCPICDSKPTMEVTGKFKRVSFYCARCQPLSEVKGSETSGEKRGVKTKGREHRRSRPSTKL